MSELLDARIKQIDYDILVKWYYELDNYAKSYDANVCIFTLQEILRELNRRDVQTYGGLA